MSRKLIGPMCLVVLLGLISAGVVEAAEVTPQVFVDFEGGLAGTAYTLGPRELDTTGTFAAHNGTEQVSDGLGILTDADGTGQESFQFDASGFNNNGTQFTGRPFVAEAVFTSTGVSSSMAPIIDIGGQCFIRFHDGLSAGSWNGATDVSNNTIQDIPAVGQTHHYAIVYDGADTIDYYLDGVPIFQSGNGSPQSITTLISWGNIRHGSVDGGRQLLGQYDAVAFSTFTDTFNPENDFLLPGGLTSRALAFEPEPADEATDVLADVVLGWMPGESAIAHDVYFGMAFDDVNDASRAQPMDVLVSQEQADTAFAPEGALAFGQTYYWRIDEVNAAPDRTIHQGQTWSFTVEPFAYPIANVTASSNAASVDDAGPENTINGSGLSADDQHSTASGDMWLAGSDGGDAIWIQYEFDRVYKLHEMLVWNYNVQFELLLGFGIKDATVEYSEDGADWTVLGDAELAQATATTDYMYNTTIDFGGAAVRYVRFTVNSGFGMTGQYGLSEVRFTYIPVQALEPQPADGAVEVASDAVLSWRAGREAVSHEVSLSSDEAAVVSGAALVATVDQSSHTPGSLMFGTTYYWKVTEINEAEVVSAWDGDLWTFTTQEYAVIDDFEGYNDDDNRIYDTWIDGWVNETGSTVGYVEAPFAERTIVRDGWQSMPLAYDNAQAPFYSEASRTWTVAQNWTTGGADSVRLFFHGSADNTVASLYAAIADSAGNVAVVTHPDSDAVLATDWQAWTIPLSEIATAGVNLDAVEMLYIGLGDRDNPTSGGAGLIYIDDIGYGTPLADAAAGVVE
jgi:F5/8 type C domain-containing protein